MFGRGVTLFRLFGFAVRIDPSWLLIAALVTWSLAIGFFPHYYPGLPLGSYWWMGVAGAFLLFGSIVVHELFHALVARRYGLPMKGITLFVFGGIAEMEHEPQSAKAEFMMAIAGPAASVGIGCLFYLLYAAGRGGFPVAVAGVVAYLAWMNWVLAAFNMIPAFPLDGGRVLRAALWHWKGDLRLATKLASAAGSGFAIVLIVLGVFQLFAGNFLGAIWWILIGMFLRTASQTSYRQVLLRSTLEGEPISRFMQREPDTVTPEITIEELVNEHIYKRHHRMFPVVSDSNRLAGCVTADKVKSVPREEWGQHRVADILTPCSRENTVRPDTDSVEALSRMSRTGNSRLLVVEGDRLVAVVALRDLMSFLAAKLELEGERRAA